MIAPTFEQVQEWTELEQLKSADEVKAQRLVARAGASLLQITGLAWETVPAGQEPLVQQAVQGLAEMLTYQTSAENLETLSDFDLIKSFSAGPYSETRRDAGDAMKARLLVAWPWLSDLLWGLLTPDRYDYWTAFFGGQNAPAFAVTEMDWGAFEDVDSGLPPWRSRVWGE
jgi:hypothetical protein